MNESICYINGQFVPLNQAALSVQDLAILRGYGVFDFLRTYHGRPFRLDQHLSRLATSARLIGLEMPCPLAEIEAITHHTLESNGYPEANVRILVTGGLAPDSITPVSQPGLIVIVTPLHRYPAACYQEGVKVITVAADRYMPGAKTINYIPALVALQQARARGALEALYVNRKQQILEGTTTNFFLFQQERLITPKDNILPGVTRDVVLELAPARFEVQERPLTFADLEQADEAFITASNKEIMPVHHVDDRQIGPGQPGPQTRWLMGRFHQFCRAEVAQEAGFLFDKSM